MTTLHFNDCLTILPTLSENSVEAVVTDPPYELGFMAKKWDKTGIAYRPETWAAVLRVMKPGAHMLAFGGTRTHHRMVCAIEDAGFEIRDEISWLYGSGFPKSLNLHGDWEGWGTALKPAHEPICLARKPFVGTVEDNLIRLGVGALNVDGCRVPISPEADASQLRTMQRSQRNGEDGWGMHTVNFGEGVVDPKGRWPANVAHDGSEEVLAAFPQAAGQLAAAVRDGRPKIGGVCYGAMHLAGEKMEPRVELDKSAARFFYCSKASKKDREEGCDLLPMQSAAENVDREPDSAGMNSPRAGAGRTSGRRNGHPTVKPTDLMRYLCRLITPPGGTILDPFMGSGSTGKAALLEGFNFIGIEKDPAYEAIARARIAAAEPKWNNADFE